MKPLLFPISKSSWLTRLSLVITSVLVILAGLALASVVFAVLVVVGLAVSGWLWWQYRKLKRHMSRAEPDIIEGDYHVEPATPALTDERTVAELPTVEPPSSSHRPS